MSVLKQLINFKTQQILHGKILCKVIELYQTIRLCGVLLMQKNNITTVKVGIIKKL